MSSSMWAWRVIVPGIGLTCSLCVLFYTTRADSLRTLATGPSPPAASGPKLPAVRRVIAEGRVVARPGAEVTVGSETGGTVLGLPAGENRRVKKGDLLVEFLSDDQKAALAEAEARLAEVDAELSFLGREYQRRAASPSKAEQFRSEMDATRRDFEVARARRRAALAVIDRCRSALARTRVVSPIDGVIVASLVRVGEVAPPFSRLVTVCDLSRVWVDAEVDEFDAADIAPGDEASVVAEGYHRRPWKGTVEEVPGRVAERTLRPEDPGRPSDTHVLMVKIGVEGPLTLKLGQKVEIEIRPGKRDSPRAPAPAPLGRVDSSRPVSD